MAHTKKYILEHYECKGQLSIDDLLFEDKNVDNFVTNVDKCENITCDICPNFEFECDFEISVDAEL